MSSVRMRFFGLALAACVVSVAASAGTTQLAPQSNQGFGVSLRATPVDVAANSMAWIFEMALDTHSQDLADDFTRIAVLIDANGKPHAPLTWEGSAPGGHHRRGVLRFAPISPLPAVLELRVQRPEESAPRSFRWALK